MAALTGQTVANTYSTLLKIITQDGVLTVDDLTPTHTAWTADQSHITPFTQTSTSGSGSGMEVTAVTDGAGAATFTIVKNGGGYVVDEEIVFTDPGATSNTATLVVASIGILGIGGKAVELGGGTDTLLYLSTASVYSPGKAVDTSNNTVFGKMAGAALLDGGTGNTIFGKSAGAAITTGDNNVIIGLDALKTGDVGEEANVAIGKGAMELLNCGTNGSDNIAIGQSALRGGAATTVTGCIAIGDGALDNTDTNNHTGTIAIGLNALTQCTSGANNTVVGSNAGAALLGGGSNTVMGLNALTLATTALNNVAIGVAAMGAITTNALDGCVAIGVNAFVGSDDTNTNADGTIAIGSGALNDLTTGGKNIAIGKDAMAVETTGSNNTVIGYEAMKAAASGSLTYTCDNNTFIGYKSGSGTWTTASSHSNTAIGSYTMVAAMNLALYNTACGYSALNLIEGGEANTALGYNAGNILTNGDSNTLIGFNADADTATDKYQTKIGHYGIIKYKTARMSITAAHTVADTVIAEICKIPALSIIHRISVTVVTKSGDLNPYTLNLQLSQESGTGVDGVLVNTGPTITVPEILGNGAANTYQQNSGIAMAGTAADILAGTGGVNNTVYTNQPTTTIVGTSDTYLYICNAVNNGASASTAEVVLDVCVEYAGQD